MKYLSILLAIILIVALGYGFVRIVTEMIMFLYNSVETLSGPQFDIRELVK